MADQLSTNARVLETFDAYQGISQGGVDQMSAPSGEDTPEAIELRYRRALALLAEDRALEALPELESIHGVIGDDPALLINLGIAFISSRQAEEALPILRTLVSATPENPEAHYRLAEALRQTRNYQDAISSYARCLSLDPAHSSALKNAALWALENNDVATALLYAEQACEQHPEDSDLWINLGTVREASGELQAARETYLQALEVFPLNLKVIRRLISLEIMERGLNAALEAWQTTTDEAPDDLSALLVLSLLYERGAQKEAALEHLAVVHALIDPEDCASLCSLAAVYAELESHREAEEVYAEAYRLEPDNLDVLKGRAYALFKTARYSSAFHFCEEGLALEPDNLTLENLRASSEQHLGQHRQVTDFFKDAIFRRGDTGILRSAMGTLPYDFAMTPELLLEIGKKVQAEGDSGIPQSFTNSVEITRPLRIGLLSGSLGQHPVGWLTVAALEALPKAEFSLHIFSTRRRDDYLNRRFKVIGETWYEYSPRETARICEDIRAQEIDILIDLGGYGDGGSPEVLLQKPAPVLVKWVGAQSASTGLKTVDWMLTDSIETPEGFEQYYSEKLLRLPDGYICYTPPKNIALPGPLPALENGYVTFGCFNNLCKVNDETLELWSRVMKQVPGSHLIVKARAFEEEETRKIFLERFVRYGIDESRLELRGASPHEDMMRQYADMDIALDPVPYSGGLTTCESLYMGVPVVTVPFRTFASRHSTSHMTNVGLPEWVAEEGDLDQYVDIAVAKAADLSALARLREGLREQLLTSPLCDSPRFGQNLGHVLRYAWQHWCDAQEDNPSADELSDELAPFSNAETEIKSLLVSPVHIRRMRNRLGRSNGLFPSAKAGAEELRVLRDDPVLQNEPEFEFNTFTMERGPLALLKALFERVKPRTVVEFGSGISTAILARHLIELHGGDSDLSYITIDQSEDYLDEAVNRAEKYAPGIIKVKFAPVGDVELGEKRTHCYQIDAQEWQELLGDRTVDIVIIDGPVGGGPNGVRGARYATAPMVIPYAAQGALFTLDDAFRDTEIEIADRWAALPGVNILGYYPVGKGVLLGKYS